MENQILLEWCKSLLEKQNITIYNFRRGLKDGIKLAIIINEVLDICGNDNRIDMDELDKSDITKNYRIIKNILEEFDIEFNLDPQSISAKEEDFNPIIQDLMRIYEKNKEKGESDEENENKNVEIENSDEKGEETKSIKKHKKIRKRKTRSRRDISMSFHENIITPSLERNTSPRKEATSPREVKFNVNDDETNKPKEKLSSLGINKKKGTKTDKPVLEKEIEKLKNKIKEMEKTMEEKGQIWSDLHKEQEEICKKAESKFNNLNLEFNVLKKNNQQLIEENKNLEKLKETAKDEYSELRESFTHLENEHKTLSKKFKKETEKNESLKEVLGERDHEDELEDLRDEIDQKEYALSESFEKYEKLSNQFENQKKLIEKLEGQIKDSKIEYNRMNDENSMLRSVIDSQKDGLEKANIENNNYHKLLEEEKKKVQSLSNERRSSEESVKKVSTSSRKSSSVFPEVNKKTEEGELNIIAENEILKEENNNLKEMIKEIEESKDDNSQIKELIELKEQISSLRKKHEKVLDNLSELKQEKEKSDLEMKNIKIEFEECQDENEKHCENIDNLKLEISVIQLNNEKLSESLERDTKKITLLEKKLDEANKIESQQKMQLESLSKIVHQLRNNQQGTHSIDPPKIEEHQKTLYDDSTHEQRDSKDNNKIPKYLLGSVDFDDAKPITIVPPLNLSLENKNPPQVSFDMESEDLTIDINSKIDKDSPKKGLSPSRKSEVSPRKKVESPRRHRSPRKKSPRKKKSNGELKIDHRDEFLLSVPEEMKDESYKILENCYISLKLELETMKEMVKKNGSMQKHDLEKNLNTSKNIQESQKKKILKLESSLSQKEKEIKHSEEVIEKQNERYKELLTKHNDLSKEIVSFRISIQNGPNPVETSDEIESQLINSLKSQLEGNISQSKQKVTEITLNYTDIIDKLKSENEKLQEDLNKATNDVNVLELQLESHKTSAKNNQKKMSLEFNAAMKELAITKKVNSKLKKKVDYLQMSSLEEKNTFEQQLVSFKKKYLEIQQKYAKQLKLYSNIQSKLSSNMTEITKNGEYKDLILDKDQENNNLRKKLELVTNQLESYNQKEIYNNLTHLNDPKSYYTHEEVIQRNKYPNDNRAFTHQVTKKIDSGYEQEQLYNVVHDMFTLFKKNFQGFSKNSQHYTCELSIRRAK
eukprot:TRINITY_DN5249_c0_g2_i1.p1 TRINITY_DN5249_c0_g2~~TRINITY_DN5249_c0_g2_i1.p1  ORF type:complete len:1168 (-),score=484.75 TRINITY_DN5249_c0_g2_i1:58-3561(-)